MFSHHHGRHNRKKSDLPVPSVVTKTPAENLMKGGTLIRYETPSLVQIAADRLDCPPGNPMMKWIVPLTIHADKKENTNNNSYNSESWIHRCWIQLSEPSWNHWKFQLGIFGWGDSVVCVHECTRACISWGICIKLSPERLHCRMYCRKRHGEFQNDVEWTRKEFKVIWWSNVWRKLGKYLRGRKKKQVFKGTGFLIFSLESPLIFNFICWNNTALGHMCGAWRVSTRSSKAKMAR